MLFLTSRKGIRGLKISNHLIIPLKRRFPYTRICGDWFQAANAYTNGPLLDHVCLYFKNEIDIFCLHVLMTCAKLIQSERCMDLQLVFAIHRKIPMKMWMFFS